jgi:AbrB family looped-hinge helix DNA binding protein
MLEVKLSSKFQATIPLSIRRALKLKAGDRIVFELKENKVELRKITKMDKEYLKALEKTLGEWESEADEKAFRNL